MKFSLKTYLITLCLAGAVLGGMTKLFLEQPEIFLRLLMMGSTVGPFLLAVGTIVRLGLKTPRRMGLVAWAGLLLATPLIAFGSIALLWPSGNPLRVLSTQRLIANRLPAQVDSPWVWNELADRLNAGKLTREQVNASIDTLITHMRTSKPAGWNQPLSWQRTFLNAARQAKLLSDEELIKLSDAFFGTQPTVVPISPTVAGPQSTSLSIQYGNPWSDNSGLGVDLLWDVTQVTLDGVPVKINSINRFAQSWSATYNGKLEAGEHELEIDVECAYVDSNTGTATNGRQLPVAQWPKGLKRWTVKVKVPVKVTTRAEQ